MRILAIETSCDETAISLVEISETEAKLREESGSLASVTIIAHEVSSQIDVHRQWGGVVPMLAKREHAKNLPEILARIMNKELGIVNKNHNSQFIPHNSSPVDFIAVTYGPGLEPALWEGINFAKELATKWNLPLVPTDHMAGHVASATLSPMTNEQFAICKLEYPAIALLISGAHTQLVLVREQNSYEILGSTRDDAVGEAFDKVARMLGLPYPGGPVISALAQKWNFQFSLFNFHLPRPMLHSKDLDFSFSGLKTAVLYLVKKLKEESTNNELSEEQRIAIAYEFEQAVTDVLVKKTVDAINQYDAKSLLVGGGVIANKTIRSALGALGAKLGVTLHLPDLKFTGDNATMIAVAAYYRAQNPINLLAPGSKPFESLRASGNLALYK